MQHDTNLPEDLDTDLEDHAVNQVRYACMSRPYRAHEPDPAISRSPWLVANALRLNELRNQFENGNPWFFAKRLWLRWPLMG